VLIVGESINGSIPSVGKAIQNRDGSFLARLALEQKEAGADMLDVNAAVVGTNEVEALPWLVQIIQTEVKFPLMLDSVNTKAIEAALRIHKGHAIVNSLSAEKNRWEQLFPLVLEYGCGAVVLCMNEAGIPRTAQDRFTVAQNLVERTLKAGIKPQDLYLDPLVLSIGANWEVGRVTLETLRLIHQNLPEVHTMCAVSNVSYGLPCRSLLNANFLSMAVAVGVDTLLIDVRDKRVMAALWSANVLAGKDRDCLAYLKAYHTSRLRV
jgi:5-methyltetrahydrofolate--homocysteine methyltransferase